MFVLGHSVLGPRLVRLVRPALPLGWLVLGGVLPDLVDKPLYWGLALSTGLRGAALGLVSGTRTFGHTGLFLLVLLAFAALGRRREAWAVAWGDASHLVLDNLGDAFGLLAAHPGDGPMAWHALLFPLLGARFPVSQFKNIAEQLLSVQRLYVLIGELAGLGLLVQAWRARRRAPRRE